MLRKKQRLAAFYYLQVWGSRVSSAWERSTASSLASWRSAVLRFLTANGNRVGPDIKYVDGTRSLHSVQGMLPYVVTTRERSCFCPACRSEEGDCANEDFCGTWAVHHMKKQQRRRRAGKLTIFIFLSQIHWKQNVATKAAGDLSIFTCIHKRHPYWVYLLSLWSDEIYM